MRVRCPCPPVRINIETPRHLFFFAFSTPFIFILPPTKGKRKKYPTLFTPHSITLLIQRIWLALNEPCQLPIIFIRPRHTHGIYSNMFKLLVNREKMKTPCTKHFTKLSTCKTNWLKGRMQRRFAKYCCRARESLLYTRG